MEEFIIGKERITADNVKFTYKIMNKYFETENKNYVTVNELWEYVFKDSLTLGEVFLLEDLLEPVRVFFNVLDDCE